MNEGLLETHQLSPKEPIPGYDHYLTKTRKNKSVCGGLALVGTKGQYLFCPIEINFETFRVGNSEALKEYIETMFKAAIKMSAQEFQTFISLEKSA
jgi:hypothetical protein